MALVSTMVWSASASALAAASSHDSVHPLAFPTSLIVLSVSPLAHGSKRGRHPKEVGEGGVLGRLGCRRLAVACCMSRSHLGTLDTEGPGRDDRLGQ